MERESRVALVTGSSRNIGRAIALRLASEGFRIVVHGKVLVESVSPMTLLLSSLYLSMITALW